MKLGKWQMRTIGLLAVLIIVYSLLLIPGTDLPNISTGNKEPFAWKQDEYWSLLESRFREARAAGCDSISQSISVALDRADSLIGRLSTGTLPPVAPLFTEIETEMFDLGVLLAACPRRLQDFIKIYSELRTLVKGQSQYWDLNSRVGRDRIYRLLYGSRAAVEEVMMQAPRDAFPGVIFDNDEPSLTPSADILGVTIHSGDILLSRGGAPTSALIARGNDYPGNFSHVALAHVDEKSGVVSMIESHIEKGVAIASVEEYLKDTKLRVMVLRLRSDLPALKADPMLPHKAATYELERARAGHTAYDFEMDFHDFSKVFCSEVASQAYYHVGIQLWMGLSHISTIGVKSWLAAFGVRHFETQEPSDLEYDPQLRVVAEWRDYETLYKDRLDNAVVEVMLEGAEQGEPLDYDWYMLPLARILKAYSVVLNQFGGIGPIPEGMNATAALRNKWFSSRHEAIKNRLIVLADQFMQANGYSAPYWELVKLAREAKGE